MKSECISSASFFAFLLSGPAEARSAPPQATEAQASQIGLAAFKLLARGNYAGKCAYDQFSPRPMSVKYYKERSKWGAKDPKYRHYISDARIIKGGRETREPSNEDRHITLSPSTDIQTASLAECKAIVQFSPPYVQGNIAFISADYGDPCRFLIYRISLSKSDSGWKGRFLDVTGVVGAPPGCENFKLDINPPGAPIVKLRPEVSGQGDHR